MFPLERSTSLIQTKGSSGIGSKREKKKEIQRPQSKESAAASEVKKEEVKPKSSDEIKNIEVELPLSEAQSEELKTVDLNEEEKVVKEKPSLGIQYFFGDKHVSNEVEELMCKYQNYANG